MQRDVGQEAETTFYLVARLSRLLGVHQVPLVEDNHDGAACRIDPLGQPLILVGDPFRRSQ